MAKYDIDDNGIKVIIKSLKTLNRIAELNENQVIYMDILINNLEMQKGFADLQEKEKKDD